MPPLWPTPVRSHLYPMNAVQQDESKRQELSPFNLVGNYDVATLQKDR